MGFRPRYANNLKPSTFNPQPSTLNLQPSTFNPQPTLLRTPRANNLQQ
ncbi:MULTISPECIES: hypothetical protein [Moorena]|nr:MULTISPECIES: hypothetical protein [Moorena]